VVISLGGGLKGTGVPRALKKHRTDHVIKNTPTAITGIDTQTPKNQAKV